jgi:hypothetical protein
MFRDARRFVRRVSRHFRRSLREMLRASQGPTMKTYTIEDIRLALLRVDDMLRDLGAVANAGACKCGRCEHKAAAAPAQPAGASAAPAGPGGTPVTKPAPAPHAPRPGGIAVAMPSRVADEIAF